MQSLHTNSLDEALSLPTEEAVKIALRTQQVIAYESGVVNTVDPLGGSYYIESLTNRFEQEVFKELNQIRKLGGSVKAIEKGYIQARIRDSVFKQQVDIETGKKKIVGINVFAESEPYRIRIHKSQPALVRRQIPRVKAIKRRRDSRKVDKQLDMLRRAMDHEQNLMPFVTEAVRAKATTGEISEVFRKAYGEFHPKTAV